MTTWFVSRHPGAIEWIKKQGIGVDHFIEHIELSRLKAGDRVIGVLPVNFIAQLCAMDIEYWNLNLSLPAHARGKELSLQQLEQYGAHLQRYEVYEVNADERIE